MFGLIALCSLIFALPASAIAPIVSLSGAAEADEITVTISGKNGYAIARGCSVCPIKANIDAKTRFFLNGIKIPANKAERLSGETGTMVYLKGRVIRIRWAAGSLK